MSIPRFGRRNQYRCLPGWGGSAGGFFLHAGSGSDIRGTEKPTKEDAVAISETLLEILACPKCKQSVRLDESQSGLICDQCKLLYEIRDDIPIMLIDEARPLEQ
jgi:uncharacterized protein YbaR (Trm112 family)